MGDDGLQKKEVMSTPVMANQANSFEVEVKKGKRFTFGKNWRSFLETLSHESINSATSSLQDMLGVTSLEGKKFLDIGSGSGLFSLAARRLGAEVFSFDYDPDSVACTRELRSTFYPDDESWVVREGSILDATFIEPLVGRYDIVYSWGVLHHTGQMWVAIDKASSLVKDGGTLFIAIYNDQGRRSGFWKKVKEIYCSGFAGRLVISIVFIPFFSLVTVLMSLKKRENVFSDYRKKRGMSIIHDWVDWLGGLPFEVASTDRVTSYLKERGFCLLKLVQTRGLGNNQYVMIKS